MTDRAQPAPPRLLLTGFEPFGEFPVNPSWELARQFQGETINMVDIETALLPVNWATAWPTLEAAIGRVGPRWLLLMGVAAARKRVNAEVRARNLTNPLRDTAGGLPPPGDLVEPGGPAYRNCTLPAQLIVERIQFAGVPADVSTDAGGFLCNWTLYKALSAAPRIPGLQGVGFIHLPPPPAQGGPDLPPAQLRAGLAAVIRSLVAGAAPLYEFVESEIEAELRPAAPGGGVRVRS
jgi:pyroglutamyl-peptidase